jgi:opacity protein-like surface antigen
MNKMKLCVTLLILVAALAPAQAADGGGSSSARTGDIGLRAWGPRVGFSDDPDQVLVGAHFDLGELVDNLRFQPNVQLGFGDDATTIFATAAVHYHFDVAGNFEPYAGGGVSAGWINVDLPDNAQGDDSDFEAGFQATGGVEWPLRGGNSVFVELNLGFGDIHDTQIVVGWTF